MVFNFSLILSLSKFDSSFTSESLINKSCKFVLMTFPIKSSMSNSLTTLFTSSSITSFVFFLV